MNQLTIEQLRQILSEVTYRPGWEFTIEDDVHEGPFLRIIAPVDNSYRNEPVDLGIDTYLSPNDRASERAFLDFLVWRLVRVESHETREWLQRGGKAIFDPHA